MKYNMFNLGDKYIVRRIASNYNEEFFKGYSWMGDAEWSKTLNASFGMEYEEAKAIVRDLKAADNDDEEEVHTMKRETRKDYYQRMKRRARSTAIFYSNNFEKATKELSVAEWVEYLTEEGRKYGLLREFRENGVI